MSATVKSTSVARATVRLIPSTATEPFSATKRRRLAGRAIRTRVPAAAGMTSRMRAAASTWPWTMCPSSRPAALTGSSRLTGSPFPSRPRLVRLRVSGTTSMWKVAPCLRTTVRQHPFTATLEPILRRRAVAGCVMASRWEPADATTPTALTIPVNIYVSGDEKVVAEPGDVEIVEGVSVGDMLHARTAEWRGGLAPADQDRREIRVNLVDQVGFEECGVDLTSALDQKAD